MHFLIKESLMLSLIELGTIETHILHLQIG